MFKSGIYKITNILNGKIYIGSGVDAARRWREHKSDLRFRRHRNGRLQKAWNKYGPNFFEFIIFEYCVPEILLWREQYWMDLTNCCDRNVGYNIARTAGSNLGYKHSDAAKLKMSIAAKNRTLEHRLKIGLGNKGKVISLETKAKMSLARKGKPKSKAHAASISRGKMGKAQRRNKTLNILCGG